MRSHMRGLILKKVMQCAGEPSRYMAGPSEPGASESICPADPPAMTAKSDLSLQSANMKTDYGPLLHTLAEFGWLLTCVLPTPIMRHDR